MKRLLFALALIVASTTPLAAGQKSHGHGNKSKQNGQGEDERTRVAVSVHFSTGEQRVIREYYEPRYKSLPPGLQKKLARGGQLPPGWQKKMQPFPVEVERRLEPLPGGYSRGVIDGHAVIYNTRSHVLIDVAVLF
jgi:Ni/Co efflux regulator RcnB